MQAQLQHQHSAFSPPPIVVRVSRCFNFVFSFNAHRLCRTLQDSTIQHHRKPSSLPPLLLHPFEFQGNRNSCVSPKYDMVEEGGNGEELEFEWGKKGNLGGKRKDVQFYVSFRYDGVDYNRFDSVYLYKEGEPEPFIGKITKIWENYDKSKKVKVLWFFRPSEIINYLEGVETLENELFLAYGDGLGLANINPLEAICGKCNVVCIAKDSRNPQASDEILKSAEFVFHRFFDVGKRKILDKIDDDKVADIDVKYIFNNLDSQKDVGVVKHVLDKKEGRENIIANNEVALLSQEDSQPLVGKANGKCFESFVRENDEAKRSSMEASTSKDKTMPQVKIKGNGVSKASFVKQKSSNELSHGSKDGEIREITNTADKQGNISIEMAVSTSKVDSEKGEGKVVEKTNKGSVEDKALEKEKPIDSIKLSNEKSKSNSGVRRHVFKDDDDKVVRQINKGSVEDKALEKEKPGDSTKVSNEKSKSNSQIQRDVSKDDRDMVVGQINKGLVEDKALEKEKPNDSTKVSNEKSKSNSQIRRHVSKDDEDKVVGQINKGLAEDKALEKEKSNDSTKVSNEKLKSNSQIQRHVSNDDMDKVGGKINKGLVEDKALEKEKLSDTTKVSKEKLKSNSQIRRHVSNDDEDKVVGQINKGSVKNKALEKEKHGDSIKVSNKKLKSNSQSRRVVSDDDDDDDDDAKKIALPSSNGKLQRPRDFCDGEEVPSKKLKHDKKPLELSDDKLRKNPSSDSSIVEQKLDRCASEVTRRPDTDRKRWFKGFPWEERMKTANEQGTLVLLENLDPSLTSEQVEDIILNGFNESCTAKVIQKTASSSPHSGQAFVIFKKRNVAELVVKKLNEGCFLTSNGRPLVGSTRSPRFPEKKTGFLGHHVVDHLRTQMQREMKDAVSTSHCSQPNNIEYDMALEWCLLEERADEAWRRLFKQQGEELKKVQAKLKSKSK
ncbi:hypothetical protein RIF29_12202 [Crotalaria pallida]|uniref:BAH domain-containing protein n=1 Tax=Crotalaria pallida TaxID=3830 RepID=A0AAN9P0Y8_CROPI